MIYSSFLDNVSLFVVAWCIGHSMRHAQIVFAVVDRHQCRREKLKLPAQPHKLHAHTPDHLAVVFAKICDGREVWHQSPEPHYLLRCIRQDSPGIVCSEIGSHLQ